MPSKIKKSQNIRLLTFFASLCLYLSAIEYAIPKPLPFLRLGLANLPILLGLEVFPVATVLLLTLLKILLQAFISGTFFSYVFVFSLAGTLASSFAMIFVYKICTLPARMYGKAFGIVSFAGIS
ncbi:MAG: Gx transporter family protein, partial [Treponema sp.]|nr:Gx transporter family protein [Treponema sp.]